MKKRIIYYRVYLGIDCEVLAYFVEGVRFSSLKEARSAFPGHRLVKMRD